MGFSRVPPRTALNTRDAEVINTTLKVLQERIRWM
jgi:hypothetical protein